MTHASQYRPSALPLPCRYQIPKRVDQARREPGELALEAMAMGGERLGCPALAEGWGGD